MRRITLWALSTLTTLVLLFSYHTSTSSAGTAAAASVVAQVNGTPTPATTTTTTAPSTASSSATTGSSAGTSSGTSTSSTTKSSTTSVTKTYTGTAVDTQYGPVQVQITVTNGKITKSIAVQVPYTDPRDQEINSQAVPQLNAEVLRQQSATIDMVSGATFTSNGYIQSLQSAIDQAHL